VRSLLDCGSSVFGNRGRPCIKNSPLPVLGEEAVLICRGVRPEIVKLLYRKFIQVDVDDVERSRDACVKAETDIIDGIGICGPGVDGLRDIIPTSGG